ncbi:ShlB/FhaC/HecB family hemolysin secretion/activation protein [Phenylobacterium sp.]|jgi:hemolysin activation/secretion protein|uniref:ShlB/FhaC/HecB family hemolysin secretion/activation protein n=1 Tax=Phenylobacterium sp. TaxID=1871053 RepID=UPI002E36F672|nr:ShlB/FhaC/HecB family hemolysin secretion/activation protein [Phenylobacterium sp.]HEX2562220.1 ShlB/FhaC/HecB family hemolysin secretion/activation protein [Phenylobacterium sp.]
MRRHFLLPLVLSIAAAPTAAFAQSPSVVVPEGRVDQTPPPPRERLEQTPQAGAATQSLPQVAPFTLASVTVEGSSLPPAQLEAAWRPFVGRTMDGAQLEQLTDAIVAAYERSDVAIYTVVVPGQDFADGRVRMQALEGWIEAVQVRGGEGSKAREQAEAYLARIGDERPLRRSTLQRYVSLVRDIPGLRSGMRLMTGADPEAVRLELDIQPRPVQLGLAANNRGTAFLGRTQLSADLYLNSLLQGGDQTRLTYATPTDTERFQYYAASHLAPLNDDGTTVQLSAGHLRTRPAGVPIRGRATSGGVVITHPLIRSYDRDLYVSLGLDGIDADNAFLGATFSDERTRALRAAAAYTWQSDRRLAYAAATGSVGLDAFGARTLNPAITDIDFVKLNARARFTSYVGDRVILRLNAAGQWTDDRLPASEQFALGGEEFGRAYEASIVAGDYGYAGSAELAWRPPGLAPDFASSEAYGFVDGGRIWYRARLGFPTVDADLGSVGLGVRAAYRQRFLLELEAAKALSNPLPFLDRDDWRGVFALKTLW